MVGIGGAHLAVLMLGLAYQAGGRPDELRRIEASVPGLGVRASASPGMICVLQPGSLGELQVVVQLEIENKRQVPVVLVRQPEEPTVLKVALTAKEGELGRVVGGLANILPVSSDDPSIPRLANVQTPDLSKFVRLLPGERHQCSVVALIQVALRGEHQSSVTPGAHYFMEFAVRLWPFRAATVEEIRSLRETWRPFGELITGKVSTSWVPVDVPRMDTVTQGSCSVPPWPPSPNSPAAVRVQ